MLNVGDWRHAVHMHSDKYKHCPERLLELQEKFIEAAVAKFYAQCNRYGIQIPLDHFLEEAFADSYASNNLHIPEHLSRIVDFEEFKEYIGISEDESSVEKPRAEKTALTPADIIRGLLDAQVRGSTSGEAVSIGWTTDTYRSGDFEHIDFRVFATREDALVDISTSKWGMQGVEVVDIINGVPILIGR